MMKVLPALVLSIVGCFCTAAAQCPATDFTVAASACLGQRLPVSNLSPAGSYTWDFCSGDFAQTPTAQVMGSLAGVSGRPGIEFAFDTKWYAFVTGTFSNVLYRLDFDNGLQAAPSAITNLGSLSGGLNQPGPIRLVKEGGQWFGLIYNTSGELIRLSFGSQLSNTPTTTSLLTGVGHINAGLAVGKDPVHGYVCVLSNNTNDFTMVRLGTSLSVQNLDSDVLISATVPNPNNLGDVDIIQVCGNWYGVADDFGNSNVYRLDFGSSLFSVPVITLVDTISATNPGRLRLVQEGDRFYFLSLAFDDGTLTKGDFGPNITSVPAITNEGNLGGILTTSLYAIGLVKENSTWTVLGVNAANGQYVRINYNDNCSATPKTSAATEPVVSYGSAGTFLISLHNASGTSVGSDVQAVTVSSLAAPDIDFSTLNNCAMNDVQFTSINLSGDLVDYDWAFDDGQISASPNPAHAYTAAGSYEPRLIVTASNGCVNETSKSLNIFNAPAANFTLPVVAPVCTNQSYPFLNTSTFDPGSNPTWEWRVNGAMVSTQADLVHAFTNPVAQEVRLKALIPGCENEMIKNIPAVLTGPLVDFAVSDDCAENLVPFTNSTTGADAGYVWDFGDGSPTSTLVQPDHSYTNPGPFQVTLTASNAAGCNNFLTKNITIYSQPQPDFSVGLPPFSCSNSPTLFQNDTPDLTDSNITDWFWEFGDPAASTSINKNPAFTYAAGGDFMVSLTATSDAGCTRSVSRLVTIGTSPVADFVNGPACVNQPTQFSDVSSGGVQSRTWLIGGLPFASPNPSYTYTASGTYNVTLTVTAAGGCDDVITKPVIVPVVPTLVLQVENPCADQPTTFTLVDTTLPPFSDAVLGWQWNIAGTLTSGNPVASTVTLPGLSPVSVTTTHQSGCVYTQLNNVLINPSPVADFIADPKQGDAPLTVQFQNTSSGGTQYQWLFTGNPPGLSTDASPVHTFLSLGDYVAELTVVNDEGCSDSKSVPIQVLTPTVDLGLTAFTLSPDGLTGKLRPTVTLRNNSNIPVSSVEIAVHLADRATVTESLVVNLEVGASVTRMLTMMVDPDQFPSFFVCAEVLSEKDIQVADNRQCINFEESDFVFDPYPNPSTGLLNIDWVAEKEGTVSVTVYNSQGRREYEWQTPSAPGLNQSVHDLSSLASGVYFITVQTSTSVQTRRFVRP